MHCVKPNQLQPHHLATCNCNVASHVVTDSKTVLKLLIVILYITQSMTDTLRGDVHSSCVGLTGNFVHS